MKTIIKNHAFILIGLLLLTSCGIQKNNENTNQQISLEKESAIELAENGLSSIFKTYNEEEVKLYLDKNYIQHNPNVPTGRAPITGLLPTLKEYGTTYTNHRIFQDNNYVVMHNTFHNATPFGASELVAFDIFRIQDGKIAEHWDAVTPVVKKTASGRSQTSGPTKVTDLDKTDENKALVKGLVENVFIGGKVNEITKYISTEQYDQHNPMVKDGLSGLSEAIQYLSSQNNMFVYHKVHKLLGQGNFVLAQVEGMWNNKPYVFYDLFRVENGKVVEHWDVVNEIPKKMAHNNGLF